MHAHEGYLLMMFYCMFYMQLLPAVWVITQSLLQTSIKSLLKGVTAIHKNNSNCFCNLIIR
jgi:hypothetical protein